MTKIIQNIFDVILALYQFLLIIIFNVLNIHAFTHKNKAYKNKNILLCRPVEVKLIPGDVIEFEYESENEDHINTSPIQEDMVTNVTNIVSVATQTDYRESEAQTDPWDPPFIVKKSLKEPQVLELKDFTYGNIVIFFCLF